MLYEEKTLQNVEDAGKDLVSLCGSIKRESKYHFRWRTREGVYISVKAMETRHLWFTLRMIWNHTMPRDARLMPYKRYKFCSPAYTMNYMQQAIRNFIPEVATRKLEPEWERELLQMIRYFRRLEDKS